MSHDNLPTVVSCWKLTTEEVNELLRTGRIWVYGTMPPLALTTKHPWSEHAIATT